MTNIIKFQAPFEKLKFTGYSPESTLRRAIILQAIIDASNVSSNKEQKKYEIEARNWIFGKSEFFVHFCEETGIEPDFVIKITNQVIKYQLNKLEKSKNILKDGELAG